MNRQIQQRQILSLMGIDCWISNESTAHFMIDIIEPAIGSTVVDVQGAIEAGGHSITNNELIDISQPVSSTVDATEESNLPIETHQAPSVEAKYHETQDKPVSSSSSLLSEMPSSSESMDYHNPKSMASSHLQDHENETITLLPTKSLREGQDAIRPFELQAVHYGNWVLLVDSEFLQADARQAELWQNLNQALDKPVETLRFPLVTDRHMLAMSTEPMDTVELANATLAGFIFKMVKTEQVKLAGLTELSEGLDDERLVRLPVLLEMIDQPQLKKKLWLLLND